MVLNRGPANRVILGEPAVAKARGIPHGVARPAHGDGPGEGRRRVAALAVGVGGDHRAARSGVRVVVRALAAKRTFQPFRRSMAIIIPGQGNHPMISFRGEAVEGVIKCFQPGRTSLVKAQKLDCQLGAITIHSLSCDVLAADISYVRVLVRYMSHTGDDAR